MATVLLTWELGSGIGHLMNLRPIGLELVRRGHRVIAAVRDLSQVAGVFEGTGISYVQAPVVPPRVSGPPKPPQGFVHILGMIGFADEQLLPGMYAAWSALLDLIRPDLVVADHSPTVLLALRGRPIPRVNVGLGFFCPPDIFPLPIWTRPDGPPTQRSQLVQDENAITQKVNRLLERHGRPQMQRLSQLFNEIDEIFLATYREFDHYGERSEVRYWGHWPFAPGVEPVWPAGGRPKVYAYLKAFPRLEELLAEMRQCGLPTLVFSGGIDEALQQKYSSPALRFEQNPLDLRAVAAQCDLAVLNATHGTVAALLLAGKPCVLAPMFLEQFIFARKVEQLCAARLVVNDKAPLAGILQQTLRTCGNGAEAFARRYAGWTPGQQVPELVDRLLELRRRPNASA